MAIAPAAAAVPAATPIPLLSEGILPLPFPDGLPPVGGFPAPPLPAVAFRAMLSAFDFSHAACP